MKSLVLYLHVHQPYRVRPYSVFDIGNQHDYFTMPYSSSTSNERIIHKVADKSYLPTNEQLLKLLHDIPEFKLSLSITGTVIEQLEQWSPKTLASFKRLTDTGKVEVIGETYEHSLAFFYSREEFEAQVAKHRQKIEEIFGVTPTSFRNTELSYNNELAAWADQAGYKAILTEGWDPILGWRSPNHVYQPINTSNIRLLMKNYRLSDDVAFRFSEKSWTEWPLTAEKYIEWLKADESAEAINLFMDYETFGEHHWRASGIFDFLNEFPRQWLKAGDNGFMTISEAATAYQSRDTIDIPNTITWADTERDLSAWLGNRLQQTAIDALYSLRQPIYNLADPQILDDWRRLQASDNFYYMCTKWSKDGDVHAYFSPYESPYDAYVYFMNAYHDVRARLIERGISL